MNHRNHLTLIAAGATMMSILPLNKLFDDWSWLFQCAFAIGLVCAAMLAARSFRAPVWSQPLIGFVALAFTLTWELGRGHAFGGIIPDSSTLSYFHSLVISGGNDMGQQAIPAPTTDGLIFLTVAGVGLCYVLIDFLAVSLRRPALAGLPMLAIYAVPVSISRHGTGFFSFAIAACGFLWLLVSDSIDRVRLFGRRFTGDGRGLDTWESSPLASIGRRLTAVGVVLAVAVPGILPGVGAGFINAFSGNGNGDGNCSTVCSGSGTSLDLLANLAGSLKSPTTTNFLTVSTNEIQPFYLQVGSLDTLTDKGFSGFRPVGDPIDKNAPPPPANISGVKYRTYTATVKVQNLTGNLLPTYQAPDLRTLTGLNNTWSFDSDTYTLFSSDQHAVSNNLKYSFKYTEPDFGDGSVLGTAGALAPDDPILKRDTPLPSTNDEVTKILTQATAGAGPTEIDVVNAIYNFFTSPANGFAYTTNTKLGDTGTDIGDFLEQRRGFCVQYASAMAWLVRAAHYPARVAVGFTDGTETSDGTWEITSKDYHAWTEVDFPGYGWVPFDATPSGTLNGAVHRAWNGGDNSSNTTDPKIIKPSASTSAGGAGATGRQTHGLTPATSQHGGGSKPTPVWVWWTLGVLALILVLLAMPAIVRTLQRRIRAGTDRRLIGDAGPPGQPWVLIDDAAQGEATKRRVHAAWDEFVDTMIDYDIAIDLSETPRMTAERLIRTTELTTECADGVRLISGAEEHARYARRPSTSPPLEPELRRIRKELAYNMPFTTRLRAVLLPPSVVARWNARVSDAAGKVSQRMQSYRDKASGALRLRQLAAVPRRFLARGAR